MTSHQENGPEKRYVQLHRTIEQGHATDEIWDELSEVCCRLGYASEAVKCVGHIADPAERRRVENRLVQQGVLRRAGGAGVSEKKSGKWSFQEEVIDSFGYLFLDHLPYVIMAVTLTFPLVVGLGGTLTAGTVAWVFPAIALIPVLAIFVLIFALAQQTLIEASHGFTEPPQINDPRRMALASGSFARDCAAASGLLLPGILAFTVLPWTLALPLFLAGMALMPMAVALCQTRGDLRGLHPAILLTVLRGLGGAGLHLMLVTTAMFLPALLALVFSEGSALFLRMSFAGPLAIVPLIVSCRLIGRVLFHNRDNLSGLIWTDSSTALTSDAPDPSLRTYDSQIVESQRVAAVTPTPKPAAQKVPNEVHPAVADSLADDACDEDDDSEYEEDFYRDEIPEALFEELYVEDEESASEPKSAPKRYGRDGQRARVQATKMQAARQRAEQEQARTLSEREQGRALAEATRAAAKQPRRVRTQVEPITGTVGMETPPGYSEVRCDERVAAGAAAARPRR